MGLKTLDCVVLKRDLPAQGLRKGDIGTVVETYEPDGFEVEFVTAAGDTIAVLTLAEHDIRAARSDDMLAARSTRSAS